MIFIDFATLFLIEPLGEINHNDKKQNGNNQLGYTMWFTGSNQCYEGQCDIMDESEGWGSSGECSYCGLGESGWAKWPG